MGSEKTDGLSLSRTALFAATFGLLAWNLTSLGAAVNGREAFVEAFSAPAAYTARVLGAGVFFALFFAIELLSLRTGRARFGTAGLARLYVAAGLTVVLAALVHVATLPVFVDDLRGQHEALRRALGSQPLALAHTVGLGAAALFVHLGVEVRMSGPRARLGSLVGFSLGATLFILGLHGLAFFVSGGPLLPR